MYDTCVWKPQFTNQELHVFICCLQRHPFSLPCAVGSGEKVKKKPLGTYNFLSISLCSESCPACHREPSWHSCYSSHLFRSLCPMIEAYEGNPGVCLLRTCGGADVPRKRQPWSVRASPESNVRHILCGPASVSSCVLGAGRQQTQRARQTHTG